MNHPDKHLASAEWDYGRKALPDDEVEECWAWEFGREAPELIKLVSKWRAQVPTGEFSGYLRAAGGVLTPFIGVGDATFLIELGSYYLNPEWPGKPYLGISPARRREFLRILREREKRFLSTTELEARPKEFRLWGTANRPAWKAFLRSLRENIAQNKFRAFRTNLSELVMILVDWRLSDRQILALTGKWLKENRPKTVSGSTDHEGAGNPIRAKRKQLELLGKYRIVRANRGDWLNSGGRRLFSDQSHWIKCRKSVEDVIAGFEPMF